MVSTADYINNQPVSNIFFVPSPATTCPDDTHAAPKRERRKDARPGELLDAALTLFVEKGFAATRVEEVGRLAGVSKGTLFLYFATKEELFKAVVRDNLAGRFPAWNAEIDNFEGSTAEMVKETMLQWWSRVGGTKAGGLSKLMMSEASNFPELAAFYHQEVIEPCLALLQRILARGVARGEFRELNPQHGVYTLLAPMLFLATWQHSMGRDGASARLIEPVDYLHAQIDNLLNGLCVRPASAKKDL